MPESKTASPWILEAQAETFDRDVVARSRELPVVIDFWAVWCQPCRQLAPILEKLAVEYAGKFLLVKAETEKLPDIAASFGVQSIPAVYALRDGQLVDYFVGLLDERQIRGWLDRLIPSPAETLVAEAEKLSAAAPAEAEQKLAAALAADANFVPAKIALSRLLFAQNRLDECSAILTQLENRGFLEPEAQRLKAQLEVQMQGHAAGDVAGCRSRVAANPSDLPAKFQLAEALAATGAHREALDLALELLSADKKQFAEPVRKFIVGVLQSLPDDSELVRDYRRKLSMALY